MPGGRVHFRELNFFEKVVDSQIFSAHAKVVILVDNFFFLSHYTYLMTCDLHFQAQKSEKLGILYGF